MCGRVVWVWDAEMGEIVRMYDERALRDPGIRHVLEKNRYNVPPQSHLPVVLGLREDTRIAVALWGFPIPQRGGGPFNTRIETARESPLWRGLIGESHCIFPVRGFYEWRRSGRVKTPHFVYRKDGKPMLLAGLYAKRAVDAASKWCASIVTCKPNALIDELHDRMPVVLEANDADAWLHPQRAERGRIETLAKPAGDGVLAMHEVDAAVNDTDNDEPRFIEPVQRKVWF